MCRSSDALHATHTPDSVAYAIPSYLSQPAYAGRHRLKCEGLWSSSIQFDDSVASSRWAGADSESCKELPHSIAMTAQHQVSSDMLGVVSFGSDF